MVFHVTFLLRSEMEEHMISRLSHATGPTDRLLLEMTIGDNFDHTATRFPDREAVVDLPTGRRWTYTALRAEVDALASVLIRTGMEAGDRIGIWAPNCAEWIIVQYAAAKVGAILVNLNPAYRTHEVEFALDQAGNSHGVRASLVPVVRLRSDACRRPTPYIRLGAHGVLRHRAVGQPPRTGETDLA